MLPLSEEAIATALAQQLEDALDIGRRHLSPAGRQTAYVLSAGCILAVQSLSARLLGTTAAAARIDDLVRSAWTAHEAQAQPATSRTH